MAKILSNLIGHITKHGAHTKEQLPQITMGLLSILVGVVSGFGAILFRAMIGFIHNLLFLDKFSFIYNANVHTSASPWGWLIIFVPVVGAIIVAFIVSKFAPEAKGHGVPEVMYAIYLKKGVIRPIVAIVKSIASAISIGTGGSVGREGPIIQIGATFGSVISRVIQMPVRQRNMLVAAGAAAGIAATFNTPIGALAFAVELMLTSVSACSLFTVTIATVTATYISRSFLGVIPSFYIPALIIPNFHMMPLGQLAIFIPFGILIGLVSVLFIRGIYWCEDRFDAMPGNYYTRHVLGMFCMGVLMYCMLRFTGHYYVQGVGYATIVDILKGLLTSPWLLLILLSTKLLATFLTLGSGASGGIFSPSLYIGATLGGAFGGIVHMAFPETAGATLIIFAMAGMAGMIGSTTGAVLTGIIMVTEMTHDINTVLPIMITVSAAYVIRKLLSNESIYTLKLLRRGQTVPEGLQAGLALSQYAKIVMNKNIHTITLEDLEIKKKEELLKNEVINKSVLLVTVNNNVIGVLDMPILKDRNLTLPLSNYIQKQFTLVHPKAILPLVIRIMKEKNVKYALVTPYTLTNKAYNVMGVISEHEILESSQQAYCLL